MLSIKNLLDTFGVHSFETTVMGEFPRQFGR